MTTKLNLESVYIKLEENPYNLGRLSSEEFDLLSEEDLLDLVADYPQILQDYFCRRRLPRSAQALAKLTR